MLPKALAWVNLILVLSVCGGCHMCKPRNMPVAIPGTVDVGGLVQHPGSHEVPQAGLALNRILNRVGGFTAASAGQEGPIFVSMQRGNGTSAVVTYYPLDFVDSDSAGAIRARPGDMVNVIQAARTGLKVANSEFVANQPFTLRGMVTKEGVYKTGSKARSVSDLLTHVHRKSNPDVALVTRRYGVAGVERYLIPIAALRSSHSTTVLPSVQQPNETISQTSADEFDVGDSENSELAQAVAQVPGRGIDVPFARDAKGHALIPANPPPAATAPIANGQTSSPMDPNLTQPNAPTTFDQASATWDGLIMPGDDVLFTQLEFVPEVLANLIKGNPQPVASAPPGPMLFPPVPGYHRTVERHVEKRIVKQPH